jgi:hypothetical protein
LRGRRPKRTIIREKVMSIVTVGVPRNLTLDEALKVVTGVVAATGHPRCFSGRDMRFVQEAGQEYSVDPKTLEVSKTKA